MGLPETGLAHPPHPSTFSIVAADPAAGEVGVAVASRFFAVGTVVPHATADVGAVATQSYANTTYGPRGLALLAAGKNPKETLEALLGPDEGRDRRQVGIVAADGRSVTYTGKGCNAWAGGRSGPNYAVQGNILTGEPVVLAMEKSFLATATSGKPLAERLYLALEAGDAAGGDSRGRQSAALLVVRDSAGYNGFTDRAIDIRVDDHATPFQELRRILDLALVNDLWNRGWNEFMAKRFDDARTWQEKTATLAEKTPGMLPEVLYDLAVIRLADGDRPGAVSAIERSIQLNPKLRASALKDSDLEGMRAEIEKLPAPKAP
ncbi:MAG: DUF1028 domain-containing protein [Candidatus Eiseniibacteriota bacterium]